MQFEKLGLDLERLKLLHDASEKVVASTLRNNSGESFRVIAESLQKLLGAQACSIFLVDAESPGYLLLAVESPPTRLPCAPLRIHHEPSGGLTGFIAYEGQVFRMHGENLREFDYTARKPATHLGKEVCHSVLGIPIKDRKGGLIGVLRLDNKLGSDRRPSDDLPFDDTDVELAELLMNQISIALDVFNLHEQYGKIMRAMTDERPAKDAMKDLLKAIALLVRAHRADFVRWNVGKECLELEASWGVSLYTPGATIPSKSISNRVRETRESEIIQNARNDDDYCMSNRLTETEIAVPLISRNEVVGVLNVESFYPGGLDDQDKTLLDSLSGQMLESILSIEQRNQIERAERGMVAYAQEPPMVLTHLMENIRDIYGFNSVVIYLKDPAQPALRLVSTLGCDKAEIRLHDFSFNEKDTGVAPKVWRDNSPYLSLDPFNDEFVNPEVARKFGADGPMLGVPLLFGDEKVGVLVVWSRGKAPKPDEEAKQRLSKITGMVATTIKTMQAELRKRAVFEKMHAMILSMMQNKPIEQTMHFAFLGLKAAGFDRVRWFEYNSAVDAFIGRSSFGMKNPHSFRGFVIRCAESKYARDIARSAVTNPEARIYPTNALGPDPDTARLEKELNLQWAVVPLVFAGRLHGQIAADAMENHEPITEDSKRYMTIFGALAAYSVASTQHLERMHDAFFDTAFHSLRTPVNSIAGIVELLNSRKTASAQKRREWLVTLEAQVTRLTSLTRKTGDYSLERRASDRKTRISLRLTIENAIRRFSPPAAKRGVRLETRLPREQCDFEGQKESAERVIDNLLENALKFSPAGQSVLVELNDQESTNYRVHVIDHGPGVPDNERELIFNEFVSIPRAGAPEGHGLGLSIARAALNNLGGVMELEPSQEGRGAHFWFTIPKPVGPAKE